MHTPGVVQHLCSYITDCKRQQTSFSSISIHSVRVSSAVEMPDFCDCCKGDQCGCGDCKCAVDCGCRGKCCPVCQCNDSCPGKANCGCGDSCACREGCCS
ncbi:metallothionein 20-I isoforms A and B-like [Corticium candelabrum]|uniref:metallothionein 20-I isoforms A and B-like n=1 Tax=Corticium candelabrum TaxID=121492 RepID=UPI002E2645E3|nr:metallothionein 20-I isoforms A and B-like [Corticium candelabrum]